MDEATKQAQIEQAWKERQQPRVMGIPSRRELIADLTRSKTGTVWPRPEVIDDQFFRIAP